MFKKVLWIALAITAYTQANAQVTSKKYPSLLWEISGNGLAKPSYLFGTMHVSNKLVFNLPDSFYYCIKQAQIVALENNPELWQEQMNKYDFGDLGRLGGFGGSSSGAVANDYFTVSDFRFQSFSKNLQWALSSNPTVLNNLLYRSYGDRSGDFEEDTYLDMYIYQIGKKLGKKITGVEEFKKSVQMAIEATLDMVMEKNKKVRSYNVDEQFNNSKLSEAYRTGNLDWLDTINKVNSRSDAYDEKFIYKRNDIQAKSIDSIVQSGATLFVGVGAAHLPGQRGVIEWLRKKGYTLRPIKWGERSSEEKDRIDKIRMPVTFTKQEADDGFFSVNVPGKLYPANDIASAGLGNQTQYADMANGSYYIVTRVQTNAALIGFSNKKVEAKLDSLLYENIPGKIISKTNISANGYPGIEILNKTRRGDMQRYRIFITPYEVIFFKMSGIADYIMQGTEAESFFNSISLKPLAGKDWKAFTPSFGGFSVSMPGAPMTFVSNDNVLCSATDYNALTQYAIIRKDIHNYNFVEEDSFDLDLLNESFASSDFITKTISIGKLKYKGYPAMNARYSDNSGGFYQCRYIIQGPHYYALIAHSKTANANTDSFFNSFMIAPFLYGDVVPYSDTAFAYTVKTPYYPKDKKEKINIVKNMRKLLEQYRYKLTDNDYDTTTIGLELWEGMGDSKSIRNDTTGEQISLYYSKPPRYYYDKDSAIYKRMIKGDKRDEDSSWIVRTKTINIVPNGTATRYTVYSDTGSSRTLVTKVYYKNGVVHTLITQSDTLSPPSAFIKNYIETFTPEKDTSNYFNPFEKKSTLFFKDYFSKDSVTGKRAERFVESIYLDSSDVPNIEKAINQLSWKQKRYIDKKTAWIKKLGGIPGKPATDYLKNLYAAANDTLELQSIILQALLAQQTQAAFNTFKDIVTNEPPIIDVSNSTRNTFTISYDLGYRSKSASRIGSSHSDIFKGLYDTLKLTKTIYPDLLPLINLDDYKWKIMKLTSALLDSNQITGADYKMYFQKFLLEAKQELKKQLALEKKSVIDAAAKNDNTDDDDSKSDKGNTRLNIYARLLLPQYDSSANVRLLFQQLLNSNDKQLKFDTYTLLLKNRKAVSDTIALFFAANDNYRYKFYRNLQKIKRLNLFPEKYNNHIALAKSELLSSASSSYAKPDSLVYISHADARFKNKSGLIYYFKYKLKKDDFAWKAEIVGLVPVNPNQYIFSGKFSKTDTTIELTSGDYNDDFSSNSNDAAFNFYLNDNPTDDDIDFTSFSDITITNDMPLNEQLTKILNRAMFTKHKSGKYFYKTDQSQRYTDMVE
ncbi:MAG: TraB/GumN family protein [Chitinophagaceae bacterium]|jgi:uncharacterized protein YbaP (TraB family)|nr:TraB/GumN family protein [Chitinophagaceae bacterium]